MLRSILKDTSWQVHKATIVFLYMRHYHGDGSAAARRAQEELEFWEEQLAFVAEFAA